MTTQITKKALISVSLIFSLLILDQIFKIWIKTSFFLGEEIQITGWFRLHFVENKGMAFGMSLFDKKYLTIFRIIASLAIGYYLFLSIKKNSEYTLLVPVCLIFAGAFGNIIDSILYGQIFSESTPFEIAKFVPFGQGYAHIFYGKVVDMLYFPLIQGNFWNWIPMVGGQEFTFFAPVFNIADSCITVGVILIIIFEKKIFKNKVSK